MPSTRAKTMADIARLANVSKPTVSRALSGSPLVSPDTNKHVLAVAREHGYAVNRNAQKLRHKRTNTIGVSIDFLSHKKNHISDPFIFELLAGVSEALGNRNQDLLLCAPNHNDTDAFQQITASGGADGFIILGQGHREQMLNEFALSGTPFVVWGAGADPTPYCVVGSDNFLGGQLSGRYFLEKKRRRFLFVGDTSFREMYWRQQGLLEAANESPHAAQVDNVVPNNFSYEAAFDVVNNYLKTVAVPPDAIFADSDTAAMAVISVLHDLGLKVPKDVAVVGYNDIPPARHFYPPITTIRQDTYEAGEMLVDNLMLMLDDRPPHSTTIKTELVVRDT
ncbi:MAG: LacI family DNA-binding transcriptional regulator [Pseudomonadales bacterium]